MAENILNFSVYWVDIYNAVEKCMVHATIVSFTLTNYRYTLNTTWNKYFSMHLLFIALTSVPQVSINQ